MKKKLWQDNSTIVHNTIEDFTAGNDTGFDQYLVKYDIYGSLAHIEMLLSSKLISKTDHKNLKHSLLSLLKKYEEGKYIVKPEDEDIHTKIENDLTKAFPEAGGKVHTGRSRNDQVLVDTRLYSKNDLIKVAEQTIKLVTSFLTIGKKYQKIALPGMTHMQPAMLSSLGLWLTSFAESLLDDLSLLQVAYELNDQSPLGSGAGYGVSLPIDRNKTAALLGFSKVQNNALYCQNSKGKIEAMIVHSLTQVMATLNTFATDCLLYTTEPFSFISFDKKLGTGSSIMPQKQNWDALELMRARYHNLVSSQLQIQTSISNLPSGYNRDSQEIKGALISCFITTQSSLKVASLFVESLQINEKKILKHIPKELFAAHWAYELMKEKGLPFREAYLFVKENLDSIPSFDVSDVLEKSASIGAPGNLQIKESEKRVLATKSWWENKKNIFNTAIKNNIK